MQQRLNNQPGGGNNPLNAIVGILLMIAFLVGMYYIARLIFRILLFLSPFMLVATLIIDRSVVVGYAQWLAGMTRRNPAIGIIGIVLSIVGFPVVSAFLLARALLNKKIKDVQQKEKTRREGQFIDYEELDSEPLVPSQFVEKQKIERK